MVAVGGDAAQIGAVGAGDDRPPFARARRVGLGDAEIDMIVVGQDPQLPVRGVDRILRGSALRGEISVSGCGRVVGGDEADFVGRVVAGRDEDQAAGPAIVPTPTEKPMSSVSS